MKRLPGRAVAGALLAAALSVAAGGIPAVAASGAGAPGVSAASAPGQTPVFCYYYIWFDPMLLCFVKVFLGWKFGGFAVC
jgi:hypothetical protein